ncbi:hypothetical protein [Streptomyces sp. AD55]|uniref:hypothetical protein n=1 Tax=Streptomyces sp. AD55 TaxID=3242895 RepID=UPI00352900A1
MSDTSLEDRPSPWGHSRAAHRALGVCSHCKGYSVEEEANAWRARENRRHMDEQQRALITAAMQMRTIRAQALPIQTCQDCEGLALNVGAVTDRVHGENRTVGGWAYCLDCGSTPYPDLPGLVADTCELPYFLGHNSRQEQCPVCRNEDDTLLVSTFTATTRNGSHQVGRWAFCLHCEATPPPPEEDHG